MKTFNLATTIDFNVPMLSSAVNIPEHEISKIFTKGSGTYSLYQHALGKNLDMECMSGFSLLDSRNDIFGVRMMHSKGVSFSKSSMIGGSRSFSEDTLSSWLDNMKGIFVIDTSLFPHAPVFFVSCFDICRWYENYSLDRNAFLHRKVFYDLKNEYSRREFA